MLEYPLLLVFPAAMAFAGAMDLMTMTIPNRISLALIAAFVLMAPFSNLGLQALVVEHVAAGAAVLAAGIVMFSLGWMGGGDAKLMAAGALWVGFQHMSEYLLAMSVLGGALALAVLAYRHFVPAAAVPGPVWAVRLHTQGGAIPYGIAISGAGLLTYPSTHWFALLVG